MTFRPTAGMCCTTGMPSLCSSSAGPTPDSMSNCGVPTVPAHRMTSLFAPQQYNCGSWAVFIWTPITRGGCPGGTMSEKTSDWIMMSVATIRLGRLRTLSVRYAVAVELPIVY